MATEKPNAPGSAQPKRLVVDLTLLDTDDEEAIFELASETDDVVEPGSPPARPPAIRLRSIQRPVMITIRLQGDYADSSGARFPADAAEAAWFASGEDLPSKPGTANDRFLPHSVSNDGRELVFMVPHGADGQRYRARFQFWRTLSAAAKSGGPIIIND